MLLNTVEAAGCLRNGRVIAYPTEAVYGLGCDPRNADAVSKVLALKQRPAESGLVLVGSNLEQFDAWIGQVSSAALEMAARTWPGPVTWLFPRAKDVPDWIAGSHQTIAIRVTAHEPCSALCKAFGGPVVSTSANPHAAPPARSAGRVEEYFGRFLGGILEGPLGGFEHPSEIRDVQTAEVVRGG